MANTNPELGREIQARLIANKIETPMIEGLRDLLETENIERGREWLIEKHFISIIDALGLDRRDDSIRGTPKRVAKMYCQEIFYGMDYSHFPDCTVVENKMGYEEMVAGKATVMSMCEHHFVPFIGECHFAYIPKDKVLGLSKFNRVVDFFCRRPQIQERLTEQLYLALSHVLETDDVAVVVKAKHYCVHLRGVKDANSETITSKMMGKFRSVPELRAEFLSLTRNGGQ
jgi:GTP cyclohydrolase I